MRSLFISRRRAPRDSRRALTSGCRKAGAAEGSLNIQCRRADRLNLAFDVVESSLRDVIMLRRG